MSSTSAPIQESSSNASGGGLTPRSSSDSTNPAASTFDIVRCSRCQRSLCLEHASSSPGVVRFGVNSYYCSRCASMVGFNR
ncbi:hypothetical protein GX50_02148 [[Emmonsia] crescens]|uniref:Uncharacterized protein n=2 Tax=[Emmonsia] crescens TaxID=73230 RepID=A0A2B7ZEW4_9EURO|nr:hypothetical protein EMCG_03344 [Emmonsia crescens UAMH 3008]PGH35014.1 hypothetical protein GX50_02148 [Emmonsia crescens]